jgi:hypothetical protein
MAQPAVPPDVLVWIVNELQRLGITAQVNGTDLLCQPKAALTPELRDAMRRSKPLLVALLGMAVPPVQTTTLVPLRAEDYVSGARKRDGWSVLNPYAPENRRCGACRWHDVDGFLTTHNDKQGDGDVGLCRRHPPTPQSIPYDWPTDEQQDQEGIRSRSEFVVFGDWPETFDVAWCGEWERVELAAYSCWTCRHPLIDHTIAPVTCRLSIVSDQGACKHDFEHGPLRCWCYCELPRLEAGQKGAVA